MGEHASSGGALVDAVALVVIVAAIVVSENLLSGIVAILLLGILDVLVDIRDSLGERRGHGFGLKSGCAPA